MKSSNDIPPLMLRVVVQIGLVVATPCSIHGCSWYQEASLPNADLANDSRVPGIHSPIDGRVTS